MVTYHAPDALLVFQARARLALDSRPAPPDGWPQAYGRSEHDGEHASLLWQISIGSALGVLPPDFVDAMAVLAERKLGLTLPSRVHGVDANEDAVRQFFEYVSLEAELAERELAELVQAVAAGAERWGGDESDELIIVEKSEDLPPDAPPRPAYTWPLVRDVLAGSERLESDTAAACLEVMAQVLVLDGDIVAFEKSVAKLPHTSALVANRVAPVHRAAAIITRHKGSPKPREMAHA